MATSRQLVGVRAVAVVTREQDTWAPTGTRRRTAAGWSVLSVQAAALSEPGIYCCWTRTMGRRKNTWPTRATQANERDERGGGHGCWMELTVGIRVTVYVGSVGGMGGPSSVLCLKRWLGTGRSLAIYCPRLSTNQGSSHMGEARSTIWPFMANGIPALQQPHAACPLSSSSSTAHHSRELSTALTTFSQTITALQTILTALLLASLFIFIHFSTLACS